MPKTPSKLFQDGFSEKTEVDIAFITASEPSARNN